MSSHTRQTAVCRKAVTARRATASSIALAIALYLGAAQAEIQVEEVIVTATKRAESIQDVPFSINAQSQEDIKRSGSTNLEELSRNVAGLTVQNLGPGQSQVAIRGVSAGQIIRDQPGVKEQVGIYMDESVISLSLFNPDFDLYDLNRVETLRGPQGTLFGSGSIGGTIRYITNEPNLDELEADLELDLNTVSDGETGGHIKGMINLPLADGKMALRAVGYSTQYAGYVDALGENGARKEDVNGGTRTGGRVALGWQPTDTVYIQPRVVFQNIETDGFNREEVYNLFANPYTTTRPAIQLQEGEQYLLLDEAFEDESMLADVLVDISMNAFDLTYIGSILQRDILVSRDASALTGSVSADVGFPETPVDEITRPSNLRDTTDLEQTTHELRLSSNNDSGFQWLVGLFMSDTQRDYKQRLPTPGYDEITDLVLGAGTAEGSRNGFTEVDQPYMADLPYDLTQIAVFGEVNFDLTEKLRVTAGGRYYDYEEERTIRNGGWFAPGQNQFDKTTSDGFTPRVLASYDLNESITFNAGVSQGFRLGGVNDPLNVALCQGDDELIFGSFQRYDDETMWNYEAGFKSRFGNGITFNAALFYADISDLQVTLDAGSCSSRISFNVPEAHTAGVEFEFSASPTDSLEFSLAGSMLESEFDSTVRDANGDILGGVEKGNRLASVPEVQLAGTGTFYFPFMMQSDGYVSATLHYVGDRYTQPGDQVPGAGDFAHGFTFGGAAGDEVTSVDLNLPSYTILNLRLGFVKDTWETALYVNNATDEHARLSFDRERGGRARLGFRTNQPRTIGIMVQKSF